MAGELTLGIRIKADGSGVVGEVVAIEGSLDKLGEKAKDSADKTKKGAKDAADGLSLQAKATDELKRGLEDMAAPAGRVGGLLSSIGTAGLAAAAGIGVVVGVMGSAIREAAQSEREMLRVEATIRATGRAAGVFGDEIEAFATKMSRSTLATQSDVMAAASALLTYKTVGRDAFFTVIGLAQDMVEIFGGSLLGSVQQIGRALDDPVKGLDALAKAGFTFTDAQREMLRSMMETGRQAEAQKLILEELEGQLAGTGEAAAGGLAGAIHRATEAWRNFLGALGEGDVGQAIIRTLNRGTNNIDAWTEWLKLSPSERQQRLLEQAGETGNIMDLLYAGVGNQEMARDRLVELRASPRFTADYLSTQLKRGMPSGTAGIFQPTPEQIAAAMKEHSTAPTQVDLALSWLPARERAEAEARRAAEEARREAERQQKLAVERLSMINVRGDPTLLGGDLEQAREMGHQAVEAFTRQQEQAMQVLRGFHDDRLRAEENNIALIIRAEEERLLAIEQLLAKGLISEEQAAQARADVNKRVSVDIAAEQERQAEKTMKVWTAGFERIGSVIESSLAESGMRGSERFRRIMVTALMEIGRAAMTTLGGGSSPFALIGQALGSAVLSWIGGGPSLPTGGVHGDLVPASIFHDGGVAGRGGRLRYMPSAMIAGARRYHDGGVVGADEVPAILRLGEEVVTPEERRARRGDSTIVNVAFNVSPGVPEAARREVRALMPEIVDQVKRAVIANLGRDGDIRAALT
ncbi:MAG: phage tail length tape measure family protein [Alphaproteobacteria bacterium]